MNDRNYQTGNPYALPPQQPAQPSQQPVVQQPTTPQPTQQHVPQPVRQAEQPVQQIQQPAPAQTTQPPVQKAEQPANDERRADIIESAFGVGSLLTQLTAILVMLFGAVQFFSRSVNPIRAVELLIGIFGIRRGNIYVSLSSAAVGIVYLAFLVVFVKNTVSAVKNATKLWGKTAPQLKRTYTMALFGRAKNDVHLTVIFAALCMLLSGSAPHGAFYVPVVFFLLDYIATELLLFLQRYRFQIKRKETIMELTAKCVRLALTVAFACLVAQFLFLPAGRDLYYGLNGLFQGGAIRSVFDFVLKHALDIILLFLFLKMLPNVFYVSEFSQSFSIANDRTIKYSIKVFLILLAVAAVAACIFYSAGNAGVRFDITILSDWFRLLKLQYLPLILLSAAYLLLLSQTGASLSATPIAAPERAA